MHVGADAPTKKQCVRGTRWRALQKSWTITLVLALFFGYLGFYRFYVCRKVSGAVYLSTLGVCGLGWRIDILLIVRGLFTDKQGHAIKRGEQTRATGRPVSVEPNGVAADTV